MVQHNNAGNERFDEGAYDEAIAEYRQAQVDAPDRAEPYYNAANAYNRQGQLDATQAQAQQALKTAALNLAAQTWYNLGNAYFDAEQWFDAIAAYKEALRLNPDDLEAKHNLELALQKLDEQQQQEQEQPQDEKNQEDQPPASSDPSQSGKATPTPAGEPETSQDEGAATPESAAEAVESEGMTPEQARQLLRALVGESETLQERLDQIYRVPGLPPEQDW